MKNGKKIFKAIVVMALVAAISGGGYYAYNRFGKKQTVTARTAFAGQVDMEEVAKSDIQETVTATGVVYLKDEQSVFATGVAKVKEVLVEVGDFVEEQQPLVNYEVEETSYEIDKKIKEAEISLQNQKLSLQSMTVLPAQSEFDQLASSIESAEKSLYDANATMINTSEKIKQQDTEIERSAADIERAELEISKVQKTVADNEKLLAVGAITQEEYNKVLDTVQTAIDNKKDMEEKHSAAVIAKEELERQLESNRRNIESAQSSLEYATKKYEQAEQVLSTEEEQINYKKQENQIVLSELTLADLKKQKSDITYSTNSPLSGTITAVNVERGSAVETDTVLVSVADFSQLIVKASISEYDAPNIALGQRVTMTSDGIPNSVYTGEIIKISKVAEGQSSVSGNETVVPIEISVENVDEYLRPGFNLDVEILAVDKKDVINISASAVQRDGETGKRFVYVVSADKTIKKTEIEIGIQSDLNIEIVSGLTEGTRILTSPTSAMRDGMSIDELSQTMSGGAENGNSGNRNGQSMQMVPSGGARSASPQGNVIFGR